MKSIKSDVWLALTVFALAAVYLYMDMRLPEVRLSDPLGPKAFPALIGVGLIASAIILLLETRHKTQVAQKADAPAPSEEHATPEGDAPRKAANPLILICMVAWTALYYLAFERAGYVISTGVFLFGLLCYFNRKRPKTNVAVALGVTLVFDLLFSQLLGVPMPTGPLPF